MTAALLVEALAVALALAYVLLAIRERRACWVAGALSSLLYGWVFFTSQLYMATTLQVFYVGIAVWAWWRWAGRQTLTPIIRWPLVFQGALLFVVLVLAALNGALLAQFGAAALPYADALLGWGAVVATWMTARKVLESWLWWVVIDAGSIALCAARGLWLTSGLFLVYTAMAVAGWWTWRQRWQAALR